MNTETGLVSELELNKVIETVTKRKDGSLRIQWDYSQCPSLTEQHSAHLSDINYLIQKYKPDELAAYMAARSQYRVEVLGHDFSTEPTLQEAKNIMYNVKKNYETIPEHIRAQFRDHVEFLKFIDNPQNQEKMLKMGLLTKQQIQSQTDPKNYEKTQNNETKTDHSQTEKTNSQQAQPKS